MSKISIPPLSPTKNAACINALCKNFGMKRDIFIFLLEFRSQQLVLKLLSEIKVHPCFLIAASPFGRSAAPLIALL